MGNSLHKSSDGDDDEEIVLRGNMHKNMMRMMNDDVFKKYKVLEVLGSGSMGFVAKARIRSKEVGGSAVKKNRLSALINNRSNIAERRVVPVMYALKSIQVDRVSNVFLDELQNEIGILRTLDHPNIVRAYEVFDNKRQIYIVLELCDGGDLYTRAPYSEKASASIVAKLLSAIKYMHDHGVVHRDLKFENIMWEDQGPDAEIKVIDFGLSKKFGYGERDVMRAGVGTIYTMAPQVLQGVYTSQADLWSVGVITYMLLSSTRPFRHRRRKGMIDQIMRADYVKDGDRWVGISDEAKDMVKQLLELDPKLRLNATLALQHKWLSKDCDISDRKPIEVAEKVKESLVTYQNSSQMKKIALNIIAHRSSTAEILELRKAFDQYDTSNDGVIELYEFEAAMKQANYSDEDIDKMFGSVDVNKNGHIQYTEFLAATLEAYSMIEEERIAEAFDRLDSDNTNHISRANLMTFLGRDANTVDVDGLLDEWDINKDGKISFPEFRDNFRRTTGSLKQMIYDPVGEDESDTEGEGELLGLDAKIPGGKFDS